MITLAGLEPGQAARALTPIPDFLDEDALRLVLTDQTMRRQTAMEDAFGPDWSKGFEEFGGLLEVAEMTADGEITAGSRLYQPVGDFDVALQRMGDNAGAVSSGLTALTLAAKMGFLWLDAAQMQAERGEWLAQYLESTPEGGAGLSGDQRKAAKALVSEVRDNVDRRIDRSVEVMLQFLNEESLQKLEIDGMYQLGEQLGSKSASALVGTAGRLVGATGAAASVTAIWYNTGELYADFALADRSADLREAFHKGVEALQAEAQSPANEAAALQAYDGNVAEVYRSAFLLELLAALQSYRLYAEGYEAIYRWPNLVTAWELGHGDKKRTAVQEMLAEATEWETEYLDQFDYSVMRELVSPLVLPSPATELPVEEEGEFALTTRIAEQLNVRRLAIQDDLLYGLAADNFYVMSLADGAKPEIIGRLALDDPGWVTDLKVEGAVAYALTASVLYAIDIANPAVPRVIGTYKSWRPDASYAAVEIGSLDDRRVAFVADPGDTENLTGEGYSEGMLLVLDVTDLPFMSRLSALSTSGWPIALQRDGNALYLGFSTGKHGNVGGMGRIRYFGLDGSYPDVNVQLPENVSSIAVRDEIVFLGTNFWGSGGIRILGLSDPDNIAELASLDYGQTVDLVLIGDILFAATDAGLIALDVSDPQNPVEKARLADVDWGDAVAGGRYLYLATNDGLVVVDMGPLRSAASISTSEEDVSSQAVSVEGDANAVETAGGGNVLTVLVENLNVRSGPGKYYDVLVQVDEGAIFEAVGRNADGTWITVCCTPSGNGWVILNEEYVEFDGSVEDLPLTESSLQKNAGEAVYCSMETGEALRSIDGIENLRCPIGPATITWAAYTQFERGFILWRKDTKQIYGFFDDGTWLAVSDSWDGASPTPSRGSPPSGLQAPVRGAGWVWGNNDTFFDKLGWVTREQTGFCAEVQLFDKGFAIRSSTTPRCDADNANPVQSSEFLRLTANGAGYWSGK